VVVAVSSTANARRSAPAQPALTADEPRRGTSRSAGPEAGIRLGADSISAGHQLGKARTPRPWAAALQRPAAKIIVAGGLTLAGWLLTGALSGSTASAAEPASCPEAPAVSTVDHSAKPLAHGRHHRNHRKDAQCARQADETEAVPATTGEPETAAADTETPAKQSTKDTQPAEEPSAAPATEPAAKATSSGGLLGGLVDSVTSATKPLTQPATTTQAASSGGLLNGLVGTVTSATEPLTQPTTKATSSGDLLGGLVGGVLNVVGGTLNTVTTTVSGTLNTVTALTDTLSHTVLAPLTQAPANNPDAPVLLPLDDLLDPILGGSSNSGGVTVTVTGVVSDTLTPVTAPAGTETAPVAAEAATTSQASRVAVVHLVEVQHTLPAQQEQPRDSGVHARNGGGGDSTPGLPGGTTAPSAPAPTAAPGHDGPGGVRHPFAVHTDDVTTTQLKLIGASLDHDVDGAGREAALPTTSPD
jgi:hypothetical protein